MQGRPTTAKTPSSFDIDTNPFSNDMDSVDSENEATSLSCSETIFNEMKAMVYGSGIDALARLTFIAIPNSDKATSWAVENIPDAVRGISRGIAGSSLINFISYHNPFRTKLPIARFLLATTTAATTVYFASTFIPSMSTEKDYNNLTQPDNLPTDVHSAVYTILEHFVQDQLMLIATEGTGTYIVKQLFDTTLRVTRPCTKPITDCVSSLFSAAKKAICCTKKKEVAGEPDYHPGEDPDISRANFSLI